MSKSNKELLGAEFQQLSELFQNESDGLSSTSSPATSTTSISDASSSSSMLSTVSDSSSTPIDTSALTPNSAKMGAILSLMAPSVSAAISPPININNPTINLHPISKDTPGCSRFLKKIPLEVRRMIYVHLLVNPLLAKTEAIASEFESGATQQYDLSPAILRTCKQIYEEASEVLYENNTFIVSCIGHGYGRNGDGTSELGSASLLESPLARYEGGSHHELAEFATKSQFKKVKNWKVMVSCFAGKEHGPTTEFLEFCRWLFYTQPRSVTVLALGKKFTRDWRGFHDYVQARVGDEVFPASTVLAPLKVLRNLQELKFEAMGTEEIAYDVQLDAKVVAESEDPSPLSMHPALLAYAQSFERSLLFCDAMGTVRWYCREDMALMLAPNKFLRQKRLTRKFINPFKTSVTHPVEHALELAKFACDENDIDDFKLQRKAILEYLEPQYQRIASLMDRLRAFVDMQKGEVDGQPGILSPDAPFQHDEFAEIGAQMQDILEGTLLLEDCAKAFVRDLSPEIRQLVRLYQERFDSEYHSHGREIPLMRLNKAFLEADWQEWCWDFKCAAKDMMKQYLRIR